MANICILIFLTFVRCCLTQGISPCITGRERFLSVFSTNKISVFKKCSFFHICCLYSWVPGSWKHLILALQLEIETVFKVAFFLLNVKEKLYLFPKWGMEARLKKGLHYCFCEYHFVKSLQMEHSSVEALKTLCSQTCR